MALTIRALNIGFILGQHKPVLTYMRNWGVILDVPLIMFVIEGGDAPIVVDTGADVARGWAHHGFTIKQEPGQRPAAALRRLGIDPRDVEIVVNTHLHWDHASNNHLFPNARIVVQQRELDYAVHPVPWHCRTFETIPGLNPAWSMTKDRMSPVDGDVSLGPGISVVTLPGHTPGSQGVLVEGAERRYLIAGDCVYTYENWNGDEETAHIPAGLYTNLIEFDGSFRKIEGLDCEVIPSHDVEVFERRVFA